MKKPINIRIFSKEGFELIPFDLSVYYFLPFSTDSFKFFMGGGIAFYYANHVREFADVKAENVSRDFSYGIQAAIGMDYMILDFLSARLKMKFRDPDFKLESKYNKDSVIIEQGTTKEIFKNPQESYTRNLLESSFINY